MDMRTASYVSDYCLNKKLNIIQTDDGDIILKLLGDGEFRIAMNGGHLHGEDLVKVISSFSEIIDVFSKQNTI